MCSDAADRPDGHAAVQPPPSDEPFPWHSCAGLICDAHCHPTDTMAAVTAIPAMRADVLTVMSTRAQDQELVANLARLDNSLAAGSSAETGETAAAGRGKIVPAFGWHPWFSHQLYDDSQSSKESEEPQRREGKQASDLVLLADKRKHLASVFLPDVSSTPDAVDALDALDALAASLPAIRPLSAFLAETRARLLAHPTALVGEIGLDKAFRVPEATEAPLGDTAASSAKETLLLTPGGREGRRLSPFRVAPAHQTAVLVAQLRLAAELGRPVSVHGVQAHGLLFATLAATWRGHELASRRQRRIEARDQYDEACFEGGEDEENEEDDDDDDDDEKKEKEKEKEQGKEQETATSRPFPPAICLHSFSGPLEVLRQYLDPRIPAALYFSFSTAVNASTDAAGQRLHALVSACPDDRLLVESDLHVAGPPMDAALEDMYRRVCAIKGWPLAAGIRRIARNYEAFIQPREAVAQLLTATC